MFRFEQPELLYYWASLPLLAAMLAFYWRWRQQTLARFADSRVMDKLLTGFSARRFWFKNALFATAAILLIVAWANPQRGVTRQQTTQQQSSDIFLALDISQSMLAEDAKPSRLDLAKSFAQKLLQALAGERIGLVFFAGDAFLQMPLSTDLAGAQMLLRSATPDLISAQGTALTPALDLAGRAFDPEAGAGRAIILITDGEDHDEGAVTKAENLFANGTVIFTVGAGTLTGAPIPTGLGTEMPYKLDEKGEVVRSRLNETLLRELAQAGGGRSFNLAQGNAAVAAIQQEIERLPKRNIAVRSFAESESWYQWFLLPALLLLLLDAWLSWRRK
jgi:Ca-activated chloride channel homolog